jgi:hypothetical protein
MLVQRLIEEKPLFYIHHALEHIMLIIVVYAPVRPCS